MVRNCYLDHRFLDMSLLLQIPYIFPNLKRLSYLHYSSPSPLLRPGSEQVMLDLKTKLEVGKTWVARSFCPLLSSCTFFSLRELGFDLSRVWGSDSYTHHKFQNLLSNAPALEKLTFSCPQVDQTLLKNLHQSLNLKEKKHIQPATRLERIKISVTGNINQSSNLILEYLIHKYPALTHLDLYTGKETSVSTILYPIGGNIILLLQQLASRLHYVKLNFHMMEKFIFTKKVETNIPHMKGIGFHLSHERTLSSFQSTYGPIRLQDFTNLQALQLPIEHSHYIHHKYVVLSNIKYLSLYDCTIGRHCNSLIKLNDIFHTYPCLIHLKINSRCTIIIGNYNMKDQSEKSTYPDLHILEFSVMDVQSLAYTFIQNRLPNLRYLTLVTFVKYKTFKFELPNHTIHSLNLDAFKTKSRPYNWQIKHRISTTDCISRNTKNIHFNRERTKVTEEDIQQNCRLRVTMDIICNKLLELKYRNQIIF